MSAVDPFKLKKGPLSSSEDPDETPQMRCLIGAYTVCIKFRNFYKT